jgi:hypothetical protein
MKQILNLDSVLEILKKNRAPKLNVKRAEYVTAKNFEFPSQLKIYILHPDLAWKIH